MKTELVNSLLHIKAEIRNQEHIDMELFLGDLSLSGGVSFESKLNDGDP